MDRGARAYPHRDATFNLGISAGWETSASDEDAIGWARKFHEEMVLCSTGGVYVSYLG